MPVSNPLPHYYDPIAFASEWWPGVRFYGKQVDVIYSTLYDDETFVPAGNMLGKDFVGGFVCLYTFLAARLLGMTCRIVTTSVKDDHLRVLWGEIGRFAQTCKVPLLAGKGGGLVFNFRDVKWDATGCDPPGAKCEVSYLRGMVSEKGEGMAGHHADYTLAVIDEASGVDDLVYSQVDTWAKHKLVIGNPNPTKNFFYRAVKAGSRPYDAGAAETILKGR